MHTPCKTSGYGYTELIGGFPAVTGEDKVPYGGNLSAIFSRNQQGNHQFLIQSLTLSVAHTVDLWKLNGRALKAFTIYKRSIMFRCSLLC